jgi:hypothetical protein
MNVLIFTLAVFATSILAGFLGALTGLGGELLSFPSYVFCSGEAASSEHLSLRDTRSRDESRQKCAENHAGEADNGQCRIAVRRPLSSAIETHGRRNRFRSSFLFLWSELSGDARRLTSYIQTAGSRTRVVCIPSSSGDCKPFADGTIQDDTSALLRGMEEILAKTPRARAVPAILRGDAA